MLTAFIYKTSFDKHIIRNIYIHVIISSAVLSFYQSISLNYEEKIILFN